MFLFALTKNLVDFFVGKLFTAAGGEDCGIGNCPKIRIRRNPQLREVLWKPDFLNKSFQRPNPCKGCFSFACPFGKPSDISGKAGKPLRIESIDMPVQHRVQHRQTGAMIAVGVGSQLMLDHVTLKIGDLADFQNAVLCHGGSPGQLTSRIVILRVSQKHPDIADHAAHKGFAHIIGKMDPPP